MSVVGFDLGTQACYVAVARQGGIEVITNDYSLHATPSVVAFGDRSRTAGVAAKQKMLTNMHNTITSVKHLIGRKFSDPVVQNELKWLPCKAAALPNDAVGLQVQFMGEKRVFSAEQVMAMLLLKLKQVAEASGKEHGMKVHDCVMSVPCYFTDAQRRALLDTAKIAEMNCLKILNETTATALAFGIYKQDLPPDTEKPRKVLFVDIGSASTQLGVAAFNKAKLEMIGTVFDQSLGGREFDALLRQHFCADFQARYKLNVAASARPHARLLDECEKLKKQMSANATKLPLNIECFMEDKDVSGTMTRAEFEQMSAGLWDRLRNLLKSILAQTKLSAKDIDSVELVGGACRMPMVRSVVQQVLGIEASTTMNMDESVARGCAMQCAILSPTFRVREFNVVDCQPYSIKIDFPTGTGEQSEMIVFEENHKFPFSKLLTFYRSDAFVIDASYTYPNTVPYPRREIGSFKVDNITPSATGESRKIKVKVRLNNNGLFSVSSACLVEQETVVEDKPTDVSMDAPTNGTGPEHKPSEDDVSVPDEPTSEPPAADTNINDPKDKKEKSPKKKVKNVTIELPVSEQVLNQLPPDTLQQWKDMERSMQKQDALEQAKLDAKNGVEEYVYEMREKLSTQYEKFVTENDKEQFNVLLQATEDWLYEDGEDCSLDEYVKKMAELTKWGDPIVERHSEFGSRQLALDNLGRDLQSTSKAVEQYMAGVDAYKHLDPKDIDKVRKAVADKMQWYNEVLQKQSSRPLTDAPYVFTAQINQEIQAFNNICQPILNKPKPKPPKVEEPPPAPAAPESNGTGEQPDVNMAGGDSQVPNDPPQNGTPSAAQMEVDDAAVF